MPDDRLTHRTEGHSAKLSALTDLEYRVWSQYRLSANDLGVMVDTPAQIQADNTALRERPGSARLIRKALDRLFEVGLVRRFRHQALVYLLSPDWQDYQSVKWPRETHLPVPDGEALEACSTETQKLMRAYLSAVAARRSKRAATTIPIAPVSSDCEVLPSDEEKLSGLAGAIAGAKRLTANAKTNAKTDLEREPERKPPGEPTTLATLGRVLAPGPMRGNWALPGRVPLHDSLLQEFMGKLGGEDPEHRVRTWAAGVLAALPAGPVPDSADSYRWWRARAAETLLPRATSRDPNADAVAAAKAIGRR